MHRVVRISRQGLTECPRCRRHLRVPKAWRETVCPFCSAPLLGSIDAPRREVLEVVREMSTGLSGAMAASLLGMGLAAAGCDTEPTDGLSPSERREPRDAAASLDVGGEDARVEDAGDPVVAPEYGLPAPLDAGSGDALPMDGGPVDGGATDGGPMDAGVADVGPSDAGSPDSGTADGGIPAPLYGLPPPLDAGQDAGLQVELDGAIVTPHYGVVPALDAGIGDKDGGR